MTDKAAKFAVGDKVRLIGEYPEEGWQSQFANAEGVVVQVEGEVDLFPEVYEVDPDAPDMDVLYWVDLPQVEQPDDSITRLLDVQRVAFGLPTTAWSIFEYELEGVDA